VFTAPGANSMAIEFSRKSFEGRALLHEELIAVGRELCQRGLQTTRSGNISVRDGDLFFITGTGTNLGRLKRSDLVAVDLRGGAPIPADASRESLVHKAVYDATDACAIVHAHPPYAIALAQVAKQRGIAPIHNEGVAVLKWVPIIDSSVHDAEGGEDPAAIIAELARWCSVVIRNHGAFVVGADLDEALYRMLLLEDVCKIACILQSLGAANST
jgi:L-fuculose-phosphate aldolase